MAQSKALDEYRRKRDLTKTPEPGGGKQSGGPLRFVVQKHEATRLHYDFRLELDGALKSWAVPKGPSLNPADKRLAMMVEDHPMDYRLFEGTIPKGNYGAGNVMVWDEGVFTDEEGNTDLAKVQKNLRAGLAKGDLKFVLLGKKLKGSFVLVKIKNDSRGENSWLLIKHGDEYVDTKRDITKQDRSALSGRTMKQIEKGDDQWLSKPALDLEGAKKAKQPDRFAPMLATLAPKPFDDPDWVYEIKWDGYRIVAHLERGEVKLKSRNEKDYTEIFSPIAEELAKLHLDAIIDGEVVVLDKEGRSDFGALQNYQKTGQGNLAYMAFDLPFADGYDLTNQPLWRRKNNLATLIEHLGPVRMSDDISERGLDFFKAAENQGLEGIMAKRTDSGYQTGRRGRDWLKIKTHRRQEVVVGGWTEPRGGRKKIGALVVGVYGDAGKLQYIGHVGGGLNEKQLGEISGQLKSLERKTSPFSSDFKTNEPVHWVQPKMMAEVKFAEWTDDGHLRQPIFVGLREDKDPKSVRREEVDESISAAPTASTSRSKPKPRSKKPSSTVAVNGDLPFEITHRDKIFFPKDKITKGDIIDYYDSVADTILPYLRGRPESLNRHPNGIAGPSFFQKNIEEAPKWMNAKKIFSESNEDDINWMITDDRTHLLYMAQLGCIELNPWHSKVDKLDNPDYCLIDLDAKTSSFDEVVGVAQEARKLLEESNVPSFPKTSGKTGLHICIPLGARYTYDQSKMLAEILVRRLNERLPKTTSVERRPEKRSHKIYLDYLQNRKGQTMAAPYCVRPVDGAPVSTPLNWQEVRKGLDPKRFNIKTIGRRLSKVGDLWEPVLGKGVDIASLLKRLA